MTWPSLICSSDAWNSARMWLWAAAAHAAWKRRFSCRNASSSPSRARSSATEARRIATSCSSAAVAARRASAASRKLRAFEAHVSLHYAGLLERPIRWILPR